MRSVALVLLIGGVVLTAAPAAGQRNARDAQEEVRALLQDARAYYDNLELEEAERALDRALRIADRFDVQGRAVAEVHMQRAVLFHVRDRDQRATVADFRRALEVDPDVTLDPMVSTPSLERLFEEARDAVRPSRELPREPPQRGRDVSHDPIRTAKVDQDLKLLIDVSQEINDELYRVYLFFRSSTSESVQRLEMQPEGQTSFFARIPGRYVSGRQLSYYVVIEDRRGNRLAGVGTAQEPLEVELTGGTGRVFEELPSGDSLDGLDEPRRFMDDEGDEYGDHDGTRHSRHFVELSIGVGTGAGYITEFAEPQQVQDTPVVPGFALTPLHTAIELDFWATDWFGLGGFARIQIVEFAHLEGGRLKFRVVNSGHHALTLRVGGGLGHVRHLVNLGKFSDTTLEGPGSWTAGAQWDYWFSDGFGLRIAPDFIHLFGESPSYQFDLNVGITLGF